MSTPTSNIQGTLPMDQFMTPNGAQSDCPAGTKRKRNSVGSANRAKRVLPESLTNSWSLKDGTDRLSTGKTTAARGATGPVNNAPSLGGEAYHVNVASNVKMVPKALKACRACRKSKIKCESQERSKCRRCLEQGIECVYEIKVPTSATTVPDAEWMSTVENRLDNFGNTLQSILQLLKKNDSTGASEPALPLESKISAKTPSVGDPPVQDPGSSDSHSSSSGSNRQYGPDSPLFLNPAEEQTIAELAYHNIFPGEQHPHPDASMPLANEIEHFFAKFIPEQEEDAVLSFVNPESAMDLRNNGTLTFAQASELFLFFHEKISPYLFGFPISQIALPNVWARSPILVAAICTVAAIHHPTLNSLFEVLKTELDYLSKEVLFKQMYSESETIDTIVALCVAGFWLPDSFMLTAVALRLAKNLGLNLLNGIDNLADASMTKDRLRLWYLLYILDGHQSLTFDKSPLINCDDPAVIRSRAMILNKPGLEDAGQDAQSVNALADLRLVSQVEFNQAVKSIFQERGWDLLKPSTIGIPWQTNLDLDKWMVSWTCLLTPTSGEMGSWPSKSTLIHYNYAMMHINSSAIREIQNHGKLGERRLASNDNALSKGLSLSSTSSESDSIAVSAAQNVLKLSTNDKDILSALKYVPIHVHLMLYYAALLLLHSVSPASSSKSLRTAFTLVRSLRGVIVGCSTGRQVLMTQIIDGLTSAMASKTKEIEHRNLSSDDLDDDLDDARKTITGWPGSVASHMR
jgi:hypothetical protein